MSMAEFIPEPEAECLRCRAALFYDADKKVWRTCTHEARATCPTGGPHQEQLREFDWANFEKVLTEWQG